MSLQKRLFFLVASLLSLVSGSVWAVINFTGRADIDFPSEACLQDPGGQDVGMPTVLSGNISGFDLNSLCFSYDPGNDTLYIGIQTFVPIGSSNPVIFGDADGDGDPSSAGAALQSKGGQDLADLSGREYFTLAIDFDQDGTHDLVAGVHTSNSLTSFQAVGAGTTNDLFSASSPTFYGAALAGVTANLPAANFPSNAKPHLEFSVTGLSSVPNFGALDFNDPDSSFNFYVTTGSLVDDGISEESFPNFGTTQSMKVDTLRDVDGDGIPNAFDSDNDNDTIPDSIEKNLASAQDTDGDGDIDIKDVGAWPDTDGDGTPDYLDADSDNDGISDALEAGTPPGTRDSDGDGIPDFRETDSDGDGLLDNVEDANQNGSLDAAETDPTQFDTDGDGLCDGPLVVGSCTATEASRGTNPRLSDTDGDLLCDGSIFVAPCVQSEGNLGTDPLNADTDGDGVNDGIEFQLGRDPLFADSEGISRTNIEPTVLPPSEASSEAEAVLGGDVDLTGGPVRLQGSGVGCSVLPGASSFVMTFWWLLLIIWFGFVPKVWGLNIDHYRPSSDGMGFLSAESPNTLKKTRFSIGLSQHISHNPLQFGRTASGRFLDNVVNYYYLWNVWGAFGVLENLDVGIDIPMSLATQIEDLNSTVERNTSTLGDIRLQGKWHFLKSDQNFLKSDLGLHAYMDFPSGGRGDFLGEKSVAGGLQALAKRSFGPHDMMLQLGFYGRGKETITASNLNLLTVRSEMTWGAGWRWLISQSHQWFVMSHLWGKTDFLSEATSPAEWDFAFQKRFKKFPLDLTLGPGFGLGKGYGTPDYRIIIALNYSSDKPKVEPLLPPGAQAKLEGKEIVILRPIHFEVNSAVLRPESFSVLDAVSNLLEVNRTIKKVRIDGHTDSDGSDEFNLRLSDARASAVRDYLIQKGTEASRLISKGWGERQPVVLNDAPESKAQNRRVEFYVLEVVK